MVPVKSSDTKLLCPKIEMMINCFQNRSFADSLNATNWSKIWIQPIESLSNFIFDKKNDQKKTYFIIQHAFRYSPQKTAIVSCKILICIN